MTTKIKELGTAHIRIDGGTQNRVEINESIVAEYAEAIVAGAEMPPVVVFWDGSHNWLADGFHRWHAANKAGTKRLQCDVRSGMKRDAILFSLGVNDTHGLRRSNADKRNSVLKALGDSEWSAMSDNWIAEHCAVSQPFVLGLRKKTGYNDYNVNAPRIGKDGKEYPAKKPPKMTADPVSDDSDDSDPYEDVGAEELDGYGRPVKVTTEVVNAHLPEEPTPFTTIKDLSQETEDALSDNDWLAMLPLHQKLIDENMDTRLFNEAALNWRKMRKLYMALRREVKANVNGAAPDAYSARMRMAVAVNHPKDWTFSRGAAGGFIL